MRSLALLLLLTACAPYTVLIPPSPELCRSHGVSVADDATARGRIVRYEITSRENVQDVCGNPRGCALPVGIDQYEIWVSEGDNYALRSHEECHALWSSHEHTEVSP